VAKVTMPQLGESVAEGTIGKWLKQPGDHVAKYEPLLEVITDKVNAEVPSPFEGTLKEILVEEGATVPNNAEIAVIEEAGGAAEAKAAASATPASATPEAADAKPAGAKPAEGRASTASEPAGAAGYGPAGSDERAPHEMPTPTPATAEPESTGANSAGATAGATSAAAAAPAVAASPTATSSTSSDARMTPAVRRLLREHGLDAAMIVGTGGGGRISREDVTDFVESQRTGKPVGQQNAAAAQAAAEGRGPAGLTTGAAPAGAPTSAAQATAAGVAAAGRPAPGATTGPRITFPEGADEVLVPMTQMRKGIAAQMSRALQVPHAYVQMEVDVTRLVKLRETAKRDYQAHEGLSLSYVPFVVKAVAECLKQHPAMNAHWTDAGLMAKRRINVGIAVAVEDGLIVPVVRDVDQLSISGLNKAIADVSARARAGKLRVDDFGGGTFTVDNTGWLGSNLTMPIINVPEVAILTMEQIVKRPVVVETPDGDVIAIRPVMNMVLAIDHRANDGAGATALLRDIKAWLEAVGPETPIY
jgi:2-oxoisovalerate dehydrogenase E2 component (dihydrolipoyl transacylase)